jgi:hypothetical protein
MPFNLHPTYLLIELAMVVIIVILASAIWRRLRG